MVDFLSPVSQKLMERSSPKCQDWFHLIELFSILKGRCHGNQLKSKNRRATIRKRIAISQFRFQKVQYISTLCTILVAFGPETPVFMLLTIAPFVAIRQKLAYHAKYLKMPWTYLDLVYRFGRRISGDDYPNIRLAVAQGTSVSYTHLTLPTIYSV